MKSEMIIHTSRSIRHVSVFMDISCTRFYRKVFLANGNYLVNGPQPFGFVWSPLYTECWEGFKIQRICSCGRLKMQWILILGFTRTGQLQTRSLWWHTRCAAADHMRRLVVTSMKLLSIQAVTRWVDRTRCPATLQMRHSPVPNH